jgi:hypothetical protein
MVLRTTYLINTFIFIGHYRCFQNLRVPNKPAKQTSCCFFLIQNFRILQPSRLPPPSNPPQAARPQPDLTRQLRFPLPRLHLDRAPNPESSQHSLHPPLFRPSSPRRTGATPAPAEEAVVAPSPRWVVTAAAEGLLSGRERLCW